MLMAMSASSFPSSTSSPSRAWKPLCYPNLLPLNPKLHRFKIPSSSSPPPPPPPAFTVTSLPSSTPPVLKKRKRYRSLLPGETEGIVQEMRFVAMRLRDNAGCKEKQEEESSNGGGETWQPSIEGFLKYLVDSKLVFETIERIVDESTDVAKVYFRKTGLERASSLSKDLEWFSKRETIPQPSNPGTTYAKYLSQLADKNVPSFLCHFYNIYFAHITGGQEIGKKVCSMLLEGSELEFYKWDRDANESLKDVRDNLNKLGEHWTREEKNTCLREAAKSFRHVENFLSIKVLGGAQLFVYQGTCRAKSSATRLQGSREHDGVCFTYWIH